MSATLFSTCLAALATYKYTHTNTQKSVRTVQPFRIDYEISDGDDDDNGDDYDFDDDVIFSDCACMHVCM